MANGTTYARVAFRVDSQEFQAKMKAMTAQMREISSEFGLAQTEAKLLEDAHGLLKSKIEEVTAKMSLQKDIIKANTERHEALKRELSEEKTRHEELARELSETERAYRDSVDATGDASEESVKLKEKLGDLNAKLQQSETYIDGHSTALVNQKANVNNSEKALGEMELQLRELNAEMARAPFDKFAEGCGTVSRACETMGRTLSVASAAAVALGTASVKSAIEFESAFAGVEKTVDATSEELYALRQGIRDMAKEIPAGTTEIAAVAEAAGQLGIRTADILTFTRVMIDLGESTNLSAEEAATALAKFANVTKMASGNYERLGSAVVSLGNNFATTEADIVSMATRLAATGEVVGLTEPQIMAIATALSSVGIEAEAGGSAVSKLLKQMETSAVTYEKARNTIDATGYSLRDLELMASLNTKQFKDVAESLGLTTTELRGFMDNASTLEQFAEVAGLSADAFIEAWGEDAVGALDLFVAGLADTERNGASAIEILEEMGITEVRLSNAILALSASGGILTDALDVAKEAWEENTALAEEAGKRYETMESRLAICKNKIQEVGIALGERLMPYLEDAVDWVGELADRFGNLNEDQQDMIIKAGAVTALAGPLMLAFGKIAGAAGTVSSAIGAVSAKIAGAGGLSAVMTTTVLPIAGVVAAILAVVGGLAYVIATNDEVRASLMDVLSSVRDSLQPALDYFRETVIPGLKAAWDGLKEMLKPLGEFLEGVFTDVWTEILIPALRYLAETVIPDLTKTFRDFWENAVVPFAELMRDVLTPVIEDVGELLTVLWQEVILPLSDVVGNVLADAWEKLEAAIGEKLIPRISVLIETLEWLWHNVLEPIVSWLTESLVENLQGVAALFAALSDEIEQIFGGLVDFVIGVCTLDMAQAWEGLKTTLAGIWDTIVVLFEQAYQDVMAWLGPLFEDIGDFFVDFFSGFAAFFESAWLVISDWGVKIGSFFHVTVPQIFETCKKSVMTFFQNLWTEIMAWGENIKEWFAVTLPAFFADLPKKLKEVGAKILSELTSPVEKAKETIKSIVEDIKKLFNIDLKFKSLKLPHVKIWWETEGAMAVAAQALGLKGIPKFSVEWYKNGGIMTDPTVFGVSGNRVLAGGEAGPEAILPLDSFYKRLSAMLDRKFDAFIAKNTIHVTTITTLDGEVIAEKTADKVEENLVRDMERRR